MAALKRKSTADPWSNLVKACSSEAASVLDNSIPDSYVRWAHSWFARATIEDQPSAQLDELFAKPQINA